MRLKVLSAAASLLAAVPVTSHALGLGDIQLKSALNAPLDAEIEVLGATPDELAGLKAQLASRDTFAKYGLEYPTFLTGITVRPVRTSDGRTILQLRSQAPITEPFATLLVEANWARGRHLREYTVLLDPPVFAPPAAQAAAPVAAPVVGGGERSGGVARPAPAESTAAAPVAAPARTNRPAAPAPLTSAGGDYQVRRGDSLSKIASGLVGPRSGEQRRAMIAIYRGNLSAFDGNINLLRMGSVLRLPDSAGIAAVDANDASAEIRRQSAAWQGGKAAAATSQDARLKLVPPSDGGATAPVSAAAGNKALQAHINDLEAQLAESRRLLQLRSDELAKLKGGPAAPAPKAAPAPTPAAAPPAPPPPAVTPAPAATTPAPAPAPVAKPAPAPSAPAGGGLIDLLTSFWYVPVGLIALLAALIGLRRARERRNYESPLHGEDLSADTTREPVLKFDTSSTQPVRIAGSGDPSFLVEEAGSPQRGSRAAPRKVDLEESAATTSSMPAAGASAAMDQGDPLAEADFHMAYGLYDQAADLVRLAIQRDPARRDLKLKLLEVFFVWGNKDQFLQTANELAATRDSAQPGEWEKVVIMGKQLAPEHALFQQSAAGAASGGVDLNLEGGQHRIDFDLPLEPDGAARPSSPVDLDVGSGAAQAGESTVLASHLLDFPLEASGGGDDVEGDTAQHGVGQLPDVMANYAPTVNLPGPDVEPPTVEQPQLDSGETLRQKVDGVISKRRGVDQTAEISLDDLGLDLGAVEGLDGATLDDSQVAHVLGRKGEETQDARTLVADMDATTRQKIVDLSDLPPHDTTLVPKLKSGAPEDVGETGQTGAWIFNEKDFVDPSAVTDASEPPASATKVHDSGPTMDISGLDFNMDHLAVTGTHLVPEEGDFKLDLDVGASEAAAVHSTSSTSRFGPGEIELPDLEPATMSEVGTKLDLARAYMDMGDPEGARSILAEVLQEGSVTQKQEAQRLLDSIPG